MTTYSIGLEYGEDTARAVLIDLANGTRAASFDMGFEHGEAAADLPAARRKPSGYLSATGELVTGLLADAAGAETAFSPGQVVALGIAAPGSAPLPLDRAGRPLADTERFASDPDAMVRLPGDTAAAAEAAEITQRARTMRPHYLSSRSDTYFAGDLLSKLLHCARHNPRVFKAAASWVELSDWIPAVLAGMTEPNAIPVNTTCAGFKGLFSPAWGGWPDEQFMRRLDPALAEIHLPGTLAPPGTAVGTLCAAWASATGLPEGIAVAAGGLLHHHSAVGCGIAPGTPVKYLARKHTDLAVIPSDPPPPDIRGVVGTVRDGIVTGLTGIQAMGAAAGSLVEWFSAVVAPGDATPEKLVEDAIALPAGTAGLVSLDWHAGTLTPFFDGDLAGLTVGQRLKSSAEDFIRSLLESPAYATRSLVENLAQHGIDTDVITVTGPFILQFPSIAQLYADITGIPTRSVRSPHTAAVGAAVSAAAAGGAFDSMTDAIETLAETGDLLQPNHADGPMYDRLFRLYRQLADAFGTPSWSGNCNNIMRELAAIRNQSTAD